MARIPGIDAAFALLQSRSAAEAGEALTRVVDAVAQAAEAVGASDVLGQAADRLGKAAVVAGAAAADAAENLVAAGRAGAETAQQARETVAAMHRIAMRADGLLADIEEPVRALAPGLGRLAKALDDPIVNELPNTIRQLQADVLPVLRTLADTSERVAFVAGSTDRIMSFVDDTSRLMGGLPGAGLLGKRRAPGRVITVEQVDPPAGSGR